MALNGCSLGAFLSNIGYLRVCVIISTVDLVPLVWLYCKAISMEWMNMNVKFIWTLVLLFFFVCSPLSSPLVGYAPRNTRMYSEKEEEWYYYTTAGLYSQQIMPKRTKNKPLSRPPSMQEDYYYTYCRICRELGYYMLPVLIISTQKGQMKSNSLKSGESKICPALNWPYIHFSQKNSWLRFDGQTVNCLNICINPLLLYREGVSPRPRLAAPPLSLDMFWQKQALFVTEDYYNI